ncbi:MAG TPA: tetratricopeptide repeat protein [Vicinamibacterales bacterium]|nr:tetratricopeptide repeat protein [Vicinamibacterales bacterium]
MRRLVALITALLLVSTATLIVAQRVTGDDLFQQALDQERGRRDIPAAIRIYERILKEFPANRALMARTLAQLGDCYEKLGQSRAQEYYQQVIAKYPEQTEMVGKARARLASLAGVPASPLPSTRLEFVLPAGTNLQHVFRNGVDISPDGKRMAFVASASLDTGFAAPQPRRMIYVKSTDDFSQTTAVPGTESGYNPFFSPDGEWLGFFAGPAVGNPNNPRLPIQLKKVQLSGGTPIVLTTLTIHPNKLTADNFGATWGADGTIVIGSFQDGLQWIPQEGGDLKPLTHLDAGANEVSHRLPHFLPDGSGVLFTVLHDNPHFIARPQIWIAPKNGKPKLVVEDGTDARVANNRLIFARRGKLFSMAFDPRTLATSGSPVAVIDDGVVHSDIFNVIGARTGAAQFSVSQNGALMYAVGSVEPPLQRPVAWIDRNGVEAPLEIPAREYVYARVSPDGRYISLGSRDGLWVYDTVSKGLENQLTDATDAPEWSPDGTRLAFSLSLANATFVKDVGSSNPPKRVAAGYSFPTWMPGGRELAVQRETGGRREIAIVAVDQPGKIRPLLSDPGHNYSYPTFSPDGRWLAYCSDESGSNQVYVQPYPGPGPRVRISPDSFIEIEGKTLPLPRPADAPVWARDGSQRLFYNLLPGSGVTMSVAFRVTDGQFIPDTPTENFRAVFNNPVFTRGWDAAPDGRFVIIKLPPPDQAQERQRAVFPSSLVLMAPSAQRIRLGPGSGSSTAASSRNITTDTRLRWWDPIGQTAAATPAGEYFMPELSRDGKWVAFTRGTPRKVWKIELATGTLQRVTVPANDFAFANPRWSPDGTRIAAQRSDGMFMLISGSSAFSAFGSGETSRTLSDWSPDGRYLVYVTNGDVFALPLSADQAAGRNPITSISFDKPLQITGGKPLQITSTPFAESDARISTDGRWIAYVANERGRKEIYVSSFPQPGNRVQVSREGGIQPRWADGGRRLMYFEPTTPGGRYLSVSIAATGSQPEVGAPQPFGPQPESGYSGLMEREYTFNIGPEGRLLMQCGTPACLASEGPLTGPEKGRNSIPPAR